MSQDRISRHELDRATREVLTEQGAIRQEGERLYVKPEYEHVFAILEAVNQKLFGPREYQIVQPQSQPAPVPVWKPGI